MQGGVSSRHRGVGSWCLTETWTSRPPAVANPETEGGRLQSVSECNFISLIHLRSGRSQESGASAHAPSCCRGLGDAFCKGGQSLSLRTIEGLIVRIRSSEQAESCPLCAQNIPVSTHNQLLPTKVSWYHPFEFFTVLSKSYDPQVSHNCRCGDLPCSCADLICY